MSWQIPTQIEQDIIAGKAKYQTFQTGNGGQSILQVPTNSYVVIFGYDFSPAGGGFKRMRIVAGGDSNILNDDIIRFFETQQISFYTGTDFFPFIHHVDCKTVVTPYRTNEIPPDAIVQLVYFVEEIDSTPLARQVYITSTNDVTVTVGLIQRSLRNTASAIPVTNRTPQALTYGGTAQLINTQTDFGPGATSQNFMQPSTKDYSDFAFGLLPNNPDNQAFATPDTNNGLVDPTFYIQGNLGGTFANAAACNYYLNLHYAIYSKTIPEQRG